MTKSTVTYWNALNPENADKWTAIEGSDGLVEQLTLSIEDETGDYTRLTRFKPGANTSEIGGQRHLYPEEVMIISGRLYDAAFDQWLETGAYASRPPGELHGPFKANQECIVLEMSFPSKSTT